MNNRLRPILAIVGTLASVAAFADYDVTADWHWTTNPDGAWSYGYEDTLGSSLHLYDVKDGNQVWHSSVLFSAGTPAAWLNLNGPSNGVNTGDFALHPGPNQEPSLARWTAPSALGAIHITGTFGAGDVGAVDVHVYKNNAPLFNVMNTTAAQPFDLTTSVATGDTIDFIVGTTDGYFNDSTPLTAHISTVPEPASLSALCLGAVALLRRRRRVQS
jgi:hypothetical protein